MYDQPKRNYSLEQTTIDRSLLSRIRYVHSSLGHRKKARGEANQPTSGRSPRLLGSPHLLLISVGPSFLPSLPPPPLLHFSPPSAPITITYFAFCSFQITPFSIYQPDGQRGRGRGRRLLQILSQIIITTGCFQKRSGGRERKAENQVHECTCLGLCASVRRNSKFYEKERECCGCDSRTYLSFTLSVDRRLASSLPSLRG